MPGFALLAAAESAFPERPIAALVVSVGLIVVLIGWAKVHPFVSLLLAAVAAGAIGGTLPGTGSEGLLVRAVELTAQEFGSVAGKIAVPIAMAAIIAMCLAESGAAEKVVRRFLALFGERRAGLAILLSSYVLSIPIFFDTYLMLLLPLVQSLARRTGRDYLLYLMAVCCAGSLTHSLAVPHPGPLAMAEQLRIDAGATVLPGLAIGLLPLAASWWVARAICRRIQVPLRGDAAGPSGPERPESELPGLGVSLLPVLGPIVLLGAASTVAAVPSWHETAPWLCRAVRFAGNRHVALFLGAAAGLAILIRRRRFSFQDASALMAHPLEAAGVIILITSAGGAFGMMLGHAGVGRAVQEFAVGRHLNVVLLGWCVAAVIRAAQGSATVAMLSASAIVGPLLATAPFHPIYVFMAIGFGAMILSWMNDSGFWVVSKLGGLTEGETLRSWTIVATVNSVAGLLACLLFARLLPAL